MRVLGVDALGPELGEIASPFAFNVQQLAFLLA